MFKHIYNKRYWGDQESVSGPGSSIGQTVAIRRELPRIINEHGIKSMIDAPCGDLHWMRHLLAQLDITYVGGDIVDDVVARASHAYTGTNAEFRTFDITTDAFPDVDLWLCRDVLFHLSYKRIDMALRNFTRSNVKFILLTTHSEPTITNRNIATGDFRRLDFFKAPFNIPPSIVVDRFDDFAPPAEPREMIMIRREDLATMLG